MDETDLLKIAIPIVTAPIAGVWFFKHHFADHNHARRLLSFKNFDECFIELDNISNAPTLSIESDWTLFQNLMHCTHSIRYSMTGYPENKPKLFQNTVGRLVFNQFEHQGYMRHNRNEYLPGDTPIQPEGNTAQAVANLKKSITDFENFTLELKPHFAYGKLSKSEYAAAHRMHLADHFAMMTY